MKLHRWNGSALVTLLDTSLYATGSFSTLSVSGQSDVVADSPSDTLTLVASTGISITTNAGSDTVTFTNSGVTSLSGTSNQVTVSAATGSITLSLPQNIHTGATPTFVSATLSSGSTQFPVGLTVSASSHATSRRAAVTLGDWRIAQDSAGDGTKDFSIYDGVNSSIRALVNTYGQVSVGPSASSGGWTDGTRGSSGFQQSAFTVIDGDAYSNANIGLRHTNVGTSASDGFDIVVSRSDGTAFLIQRENKPLNLRTNNGNKLQIQAAGHTVPSADNTYTLGGSGARWSQLWAGTTTINTSDSRTKTDIEDSPLGLEFVLQLRPVSFRYIVGGRKEVLDESGRVVTDEDGNPTLEDLPGQRHHYGFVAQEVQQALDGRDFGGWLLTDKDDPDSEQALRYEEFIAPVVRAIQEQQELIAALELRIEALGG